MSADTAAVFVDLVAHRREQMAEVADSLQAALDLAEIVQTEATRRHFQTVEQFLAGAPDEQTRGLWSALLDRAIRSTPTSNGDTP